MDSGRSVRHRGGMPTRTVLLLAAAAILAVACASEPSPSPTPMPEPTVAQPTELAPGGSFPTFTVDLIEQVGADASVVIADQSGTLTGATSAAPGDGASVPEGAIETASLSADPNTIVLTWSGMPCDTVHALTIAPDGVSMRLDRQRCEGDALGVDHVLLLTFDHAVDVTKVNPVLRTTG
jgi:hypothetical protein